MVASRLRYSDLNMMIKQVEHMLSKCYRQFAFAVLLFLAGNARFDSDDFCNSRLQNVLFPNTGNKKAFPSSLPLPIVAKASQLNLADSKRGGKIFHSMEEKDMESLTLIHKVY